MSDIALQLVGPVIGGAVSGLVLVAGLRVEVRGVKAAVAYLTKRIDDHIDNHNKGAACA